MLFSALRHEASVFCSDSSLHEMLGRSGRQDCGLLCLHLLILWSPLILFAWQKTARISVISTHVLTSDLQ